MPCSPVDVLCDTASKSVWDPSGEWGTPKGGMAK